MYSERNTMRIAGIAGLIAVVGNVGGVLFLGDMPSAYRLARLDEWVAAVAAQPGATVGSALAFTLGLVAMAGWAWQLGRSIDSPLGRAGAALIAVTSLFNAAGTLTPIVQALHVGSCGAACEAAGRALLGLTLALDAFFNLGLGVGLLLCAAGAKKGRWTRALMAVAGLAALPVAGQAVWDAAATMLAIAAPLWLSLIIKTSVVWMRSDARSAY